MQKIWIGEAIVIVSFQTPEFLKVKRYRYFYAKKFESSNSNPRIFKDKAIQVLLSEKIWFYEAIVSL